MSSSSLTTEPSPFWERKWFLGLVFGGFALVYLLNRSPYVGFNDGLTFLYTASTGFDLATNATSHFFYNNLQHVLLSVLPFLPDVLVLTLFSIGCALLTLWMMYRTARLMTASQGLALLPVVVLGFSFTFWQQSEIIEVYAFNNLLFILFLHCTLKDLLRDRRHNYWIASLLLGIGLITHIQHILSVPFFLGYLFWRNELRPWQKMLGMLPWMALMSILFILPAVTGLHGWKAVFFESKFQDELLGVDVWALVKGVLLGLGMLVYNFHLALIPIGLGWRRLWKTDRRLVFWLLALGLPYLAFAVKYSVNDNHVFYLCFYMVLVLPLVYALGDTVAVQRKWLGRMYLGAALLPVVLYASATLLAVQVPAMKKYDEEKAYKGGVVHLLWPGKAWAKDPLALAEEIYNKDPYPAESEMPEWNYKMAVAYLIEHLRVPIGQVPEIEDLPPPPTPWPPAGKPDLGD